METSGLKANFVNGMRVTDEAAIAVVKRTLDETGGKGASYLLFNTMPSLGDFARPEPPTGRLFTQAWKRAGHPDFYLSQP